jgi:hypothetical protein
MGRVCGTHVKANKRTQYLSGNLKLRDDLDELSVDVKTNLYRNRVWGCVLLSSGLGYEPTAGCCELGNSCSESIIVDNFLSSWDIPAFQLYQVNFLTGHTFR